jgi:hypothetical protein
VGISHDKYTVSEGNLGVEIFDLRYENDITTSYYFDGIQISNEYHKAFQGFKITDMLELYNNV